jgi:thioredoxin reductase
MSKLYDVAIVGGGVAGLSAALILGRCLRSVLVFDDGHPRNKASHAAHCLLANEGIAPAELLSRSRRELQNYQHVAVQQRTVDRIHSEQKAFAIFSEGGLVATSRKVLLTTGLNQLPDIDGIENYYGRSVHHCPYCDGYEHRDQVIIAYGKGDKGAGLALMMKQWTSDVILAPMGRSLRWRCRPASRRPISEFRQRKSRNLRAIYRGAYSVLFWLRARRLTATRCFSQPNALNDPISGTGWVASGMRKEAPLLIR